MSPTAQLQAFAQSVYLVIKNRYYDDITSSDGLIFVAQIADFLNQFIDELEVETTASGEPVDWQWMRQSGYTLGTATKGGASITQPPAIFNLIANPSRYVQVVHDGAVVSNWAVVAPDNITNKSDRVTEDMCSSVGGNIVFSRAFKDYEDGGTIIGDVTLPIPRVIYNPTTGVATNAKVLTTVKPKQLLVLGVAKNSSLPDIVQGKLSPSFVQKFNDLLQGAILRNSASGRSDTVESDDLSYISGIGF